MPRNNPMAYISPQMQRQSRRDRDVGGQVEDEYLGQLRGFDAQEGARTAARASFDEFEEDLGRNIGDLRGSQVSRGRVGSQSGFGMQDEDELYRDSLSGLMRTLGQNAIQSQGQQLQAMGQLGGYGERTTERGLDIMASERDYGLQREEMDRRDKADKRKGMFGLAGRVGGSLLGPAGSVVGGRLAEGLESLIS